MSKQPVRTRLLDALLSEIVLPPLPARQNVLDEEEMFQHNAALRQILGSATCVEATNVARFFDESYMVDDESGAAFWIAPTRTHAEGVGCRDRRGRPAQPEPLGDVP